MQHNERWLPITGYEGLYEVSDQGRVRSLDRVVVNMCRGGERRTPYPGMVLRPGVRAKGHLHVVLTSNNKKSTITIHRLVCLAFHGPQPTEASVVRHLNGNPTDNRADNVAWGTHSENCHDRVAHGRDQNANKTHCKRGHPFDEANTIIRKDGRECRECSRMWHAARRREQRRLKRVNA